MSNILNRSLIHFLLCVLLSSFLVSCGGTDDPAPKALPPRPVVKWQNPPASDKLFYTDESVVLQANKTGGYIEEVEWKINGVIVTNQQEIVFNQDSSLISLAHSFDEAGRYDVSLRVANEGGESTILQILNFRVREIPLLDRLAGQVSKTWRFSSIKLNGTNPELIKDHEKDNTLTFFRVNQSGAFVFNCVFNKGTLTNGETDSNGTWRFIFNDRFLQFSRIDVFPTNIRIVEITPTEMTLGRSTGSSEIIYKLVSVQ